LTNEVLVDNQKPEVISHPVGGAVNTMRASWNWPRTTAFIPAPAGRQRARTKGKDEHMLHYIKENFFARYREFECLAHLNQLAEHWFREEADQRLHGTVKEVVAERLPAGYRSSRPCR
jgi:transposase